jgi:phage baseplate assembly protein W
MSKSLKLNNGDLVIGRARSFENVEGIDKLKQDLSLWILEQIGTDPLTPTYGSTLDGGIIDGQPIPSFIGQTLTSEAFERIEIDVQDLVARYQASQLDKIKREVLQYSGQHTLSPDETIKLIRAVRAVSVGDVVVVRVDLTTVSGANIHLTLPLQ